MQKVLIIITTIVLFTGCLYAISNSSFLDKDVCLDSGICKEGFVLNTEEGQQIIVNKQSCIKNKGIWNDKKKFCNFNISHQVH